MPIITQSEIVRKMAVTKSSYLAMSEVSPYVVKMTIEYTRTKKLRVKLKSGRDNYSMLPE